MLCLIWLDKKYCRWTSATAMLYINIYLLRECLRLVLFVVLFWLPKIYLDQWFFDFSVHGDWQKNNICLQCWLMNKLYFFIKTIRAKLWAKSHSKGFWYLSDIQTSLMDKLQRVLKFILPVLKSGRSKQLWDQGCKMIKRNI